MFISLLNDHMKNKNKNQIFSENETLILVCGGNVGFQSKLGEPQRCHSGSEEGKMLLSYKKCSLPNAWKWRQRLWSSTHHCPLLFHSQGRPWVSAAILRIRKQLHETATWGPSGNHLDSSRALYLPIPHPPTTTFGPFSSHCKEPRK